MRNEERTQNLGSERGWCPWVIHQKRINCNGWRPGRSYRYSPIFSGFMCKSGWFNINKTTQCSHWTYVSPFTERCSGSLTDDVCRTSCNFAVGLYGNYTSFGSVWTVLCIYSTNFPPSNVRSSRPFPTSHLNMVYTKWEVFSNSLVSPLQTRSVKKIKVLYERMNLTFHSLYLS